MTTQGEVESMSLPVKLNPSEISECGTQLAANLVRRARVAAEKKEQMGRYATILKQLDEQIKDLSESIATGSETREVEIKKVPVFDEGMMTFQRVDTHEIVDSRPLYDTERQMTLKDPDEKPKTTRRKSPGKNK